MDEVFRILSYIALTQPLGRAYKVTDELFDLSTMAMEYFKENIEPSLPEITYFGSDFLDFTPPFSSPSKRMATPLTVGFDSPISSRASAVGSSCSEPPIPYSGMDGVEVDYEEANSARDSAPQSNMVLRKRIRRIRAGMKKYNTQLDEVKRELKTCKSKMDTQNKQVSEYASRLDDYDKKFEENSRKFGTLLTELNKCKTELQYYRSRSHLMQVSYRVRKGKVGRMKDAVKWKGEWVQVEWWVGAVIGRELLGGVLILFLFSASTVAQA